MGLERKKAIGVRGSWYAEVDGEKFPVIHKYWLQRGLVYHDPEVRPGEPRCDEFMAQIRATGRVILQKDKEPKNSEGKTILERDGYIAMFAVELDPIHFDESGLTFRLLRRLCELE